jgi:hypothetical protein
LKNRQNTGKRNQVNQSPKQVNFLRSSKYHFRNKMVKGCKITKKNDWIYKFNINLWIIVCNRQNKPTKKIPDNSALSRILHLNFRLSL